MTSKLKNAVDRLEAIHEQIQALLAEATSIVDEHLPPGHGYRARKTWIPMIDMALGYRHPDAKDPQGQFTMEDSINAMHAAVRKGVSP